MFWSLNYSSSNVCTQFITSPAQAPVGTYLGEISTKLDDYSSRRANMTHNNCRLQILLISVMYWSREPKRVWERYSEGGLDWIFRVGFKSTCTALAWVILLCKGHVPAMSHLHCFHHITHIEDYLHASFWWSKHWG